MFHLLCGEGIGFALTQFDTTDKQETMIALKYQQTRAHTHKHIQMVSVGLENISMNKFISCVPVCNCC